MVDTPRIPTVMPPIARASSHTPGDEFRWMKEPRHTEIVEYLTAERGFYTERFRPLESLAGDLLDELIGMTPPAEKHAPWDDRGYRYWRELPDGADLPRIMRSGSDGSAQVLIDLAAVAASAGSTYADLGSFEVSPDGRLIAWAADTSGAEVFDLRIRDVATGRDLPVGVDETHYGVAWSADSRFVFYLVPDAAWRPHEVHRLDVRTGETVRVLVEPDERYFLEVEATRSGDWIVITSASRLTTEVWVIPTAGPTMSPRSLGGRREGLEYRVEHEPVSDRWLIVTNRDHVEFDVMSAPTSTTSPDEWSPWLVSGPGERLHEVLCFAPADDSPSVVVEGRRGGLPHLQVLAVDGTPRLELGPETPAGAIRLGRNVDVENDYLTVIMQSFTEPPLWWDVSLSTGERVLRHAREVPGLQASDFVGEVAHVTARDGWVIPVVVSRHRDTPLDGTAPCLLYAYGSYESVDDPEFDLALIPLLNRGVVYAKAHIRGGGEVGRSQWLDGRMTSKANTFRDFADVASALGSDVDGRGQLVDSRRIVGRGGSAGGLLQGVSYSTRPELWAGIVAEVPFVDVVNSMSDTSIPLTVNEWEEWGSPFIPEQRAYLEGYAPYENIPPAESRPPLLVTGAVHDPRVLVHEPAKWVARLRASDPRRGAGDAGHGPSERGLVLFRVELGEGSHGGPAGRFSALAYEAEVDAWILSALRVV